MLQQFEGEGYDLHIKLRDVISAIDFDALNRAINDLADIVEPLARFANILR